MCKYGTLAALRVAEVQQFCQISRFSRQFADATRRLQNLNIGMLYFKSPALLTYEYGEEIEE